MKRLLAKGRKWLDWFMESVITAERPMMSNDFETRSALPDPIESRLERRKLQ